jgi:hypothetical protein
MFARLWITLFALGSAASGAVQGFAIAGDSLFTWGDGIQLRTLPGLRSTEISKGKFAQGGTVFDVDGDGRPDLVVVQIEPKPALIWLHAPDWKAREIDTGVEALDLIGTTLLGHRGVLLIHKQIQVRFYEAPPNMDGRWNETEIYSIYTPSREGGLRMAEVNGDSLPDILCGNYWMQSPREFGLPWREFAIDLWNEERNSALLRVAWADLLGAGKSQRIAAQRAMPHARLSWFEVPSDPRLLWREHELGKDLNLTSLETLEAADFDDDGATDILVGENAQQGRLILFHNEGSGRFTAKILVHGEQIVGARKYHGRILLISNRGVRLIR